MISAFVGGFMTCMGFYAAYKVIQTGVVQGLALRVKQALEDVKEADRKGNGR